MLNKIVNITSNSGYNNPKGKNPSAQKYLIKDSISSGSGDKMELSPALIFLKKLEWTLKEVKVSEDKYFVTFDYRNFEFNAFLNPSNVNLNSYIKYRIKLLSPSLFEEEIKMYDYSKLTIELNLSIGFYKKPPGILGIITSRDPSAQSFFDNEFRNSILSLGALFEKLFIISIENVQRKSEIIEDVVGDTLMDLRGLTRINDLLLLFLEKLTGEKIYPQIIPFNNKEDERLILVDAVNINTIS